MKSIFEVTISQDVGDSRRYVALRETFVVGATNAIVATRKALREAKGNGFMKSRPLEVEKVDRIVRDFD